MKARRSLGKGIAMAMLVALARVAAAAEEGTLQQRVTALEKSVADSREAAANAMGVDFHALLTTNYLYSVNRPSSGNVQNRVFDRQHNTFSINDAALFLSRNKEDEAFGFSVVVDFGETARYTGRDWDGDGALTSGEETNYFELREAFLTYKLPWLGQTLKAGTFTTLLGYEVFKTPTNFNPNISNSIIFGYSNPFTHAGVLLNTPLGDIGGLDIGLVNGWDNMNDQNTGKTLLLGLALKPLEELSTYTAFAYGSEQLPMDQGGFGEGSKRTELTVNATYTVTDELSLAMDSVYGHETNIVNGGADNALWYGLAGYVMVKANDWLSFSLRAEFLDDADGVRLSYPTGVSGGATVWEITPTVAFQLTEHLLARVEYRHDEASKKIYEKEDRFQSGSDTFGGELILAF